MSSGACIQSIHRLTPHRGHSSLAGHMSNALDADVVVTPLSQASSDVGSSLSSSSDSSSCTVMRKQKLNVAIWLLKPAMRNRVSTVVSQGNTAQCVNASTTSRMGETITKMQPSKERAAQQKITTMGHTQQQQCAKSSARKEMTDNFDARANMQCDYWTLSLSMATRYNL